MTNKTLIADTHDIFNAFIVNGLHHHYSIYCQFPFNEDIVNQHSYGENFDIEFNDGHRHHQ